MIIILPDLPILYHENEETSSVWGSNLKPHKVTKRPALTPNRLDVTEWVPHLKYVKLPSQTHPMGSRYEHPLLNKNTNIKNIGHTISTEIDNVRVFALAQGNYTIQNIAH